MFGDIAQTTVVGLVVMVLSIVAQGIAARIFSADELSAYLMIRKANIALVPIVILGMSMALSRHMPMFAGQGRAGRRRLASVTMSVVFISCTVVVLTLLQFKSDVAALLFKSADYAEFVPGLVGFMLGTTCLTMVSAYFQGRMWMKVVNIMQFVTTGVVQLVVLLTWSDQGPGWIVERMGLGILIVALVFLLVAIYDSIWGADEGIGEPVPPLKESVKKLLGYGLPRVPSFLAMSGLLMLSPLLVVQLSDLGTSRYIVTALNLLNFAAVPFQPMTIVFLPRFAEMKSLGKFEEMSRLTSMLTDSLVQLGVLATCQMVIFIPVILRVWMEFTEPRAHALTTIIALAIPAYLVFQVLRNPIDSFTPVPVNTYTITGALVLLGVFTWGFNLFMQPEFAVAWATSVAFIALGAATYTLARRLLVQPGTIQGNRGYFSFLVLCMLLFVAGLGVKTGLQGLGDALSLAVIAVWALIVIAVFVSVQVKLGVVWAKELRERTKKWK